MSLAIATLKKGEGRSLKVGGPWIYDNEIASILGSFENGDMVVVHDFDGYPLGRGFINTNSKIRIRMMTRRSEQEINEDFLRKRVWDVRCLRRPLGRRQGMCIRDCGRWSIGRRRRIIPYFGRRRSLII